MTLTPREFGEKTGLHKSAVSRLKSGKRKPSLAAALKIYAQTREKYGALADMTNRQVAALQRTLGDKL